jgi:hypothetical protein
MGPISCVRPLPPAAVQICCVKIALDPSVRLADCPAVKFFRMPSDVWADVLRAAIAPRCSVNLQSIFPFGPSVMFIGAHRSSLFGVTRRNHF